MRREREKEQFKFFFDFEFFKIFLYKFLKENEGNLDRINVLYNINCSEKKEKHKKWRKKEKNRKEYERKKENYSL